jgi:hypothetical protein
MTTTAPELPASVATNSCPSLTTAVSGSAKWNFGPDMTRTNTAPDWAVGSVVAVVVVVAVAVVVLVPVSVVVAVAVAVVILVVVVAEVGTEVVVLTGGDVVLDAGGGPVAEISISATDPTGSLVVMPRTILPAFTTKRVRAEGSQGIGPREVEPLAGDHLDEAAGPGINLGN